MCVYVSLRVTMNKKMNENLCLGYRMSTNICANTTRDIYVSMCRNWSIGTSKCGYDCGLDYEQDEFMNLS